MIDQVVEVLDDSHKNNFHFLVQIVVVKTSTKNSPYIKTKHGKGGKIEIAKIHEYDNIDKIGIIKGWLTNK